MAIMKRRFFPAAAILIFCFVSTAVAEKWSRTYISSLPDSAFAAIEFTKEGRKIRYLPHHNYDGKIDIPHLKSALGRVHQVKWIHPESFDKAKEHLEQHYREYEEQQIK